MINAIRFVAKLAMLIAGLFLIYLALSSVISSANKSVQDQHDGTATATITTSYVSTEPFGTAATKLTRDTQAFYNMQITRTLGEPCYVKTNWRWTLHLPTGNLVMWTSSNGEFYGGDKNENLAQAFDVPKKLLPGQYTLSRLSVFKCGDQEDFARTVRNIDIIVE